MRLTAQAKRPQKQVIVQAVPLPAPVGGWDGISPLANMPEDRAVQMDNWVPRPGWIEPRKGFIPQCTGLGGHNIPVQTVMSYNSINGTRKLFGVAASTIYDCTTPGVAIATPVTGLSSSRLQYVLFANPATSTYLVTTDGSQSPWVFDGTTWTQPQIFIGNSQGSIIWSVNMVPGETINLNGTIVKFVTGTPIGNEVAIQSTLAQTLASLVTFLSTSADSNISQCTYSQALGTTLFITYSSSGVQGNSFTISAGFATGTITFASNPSNGDTITINGTSVQFVTSSPSGNQVGIAATLPLTLAALLSFLTGSTNASIASCTYTVKGSVLQIQAATEGVIGNAILISASAATASGATLAGGSTAVASDTQLDGGGLNYGITSNQFVSVNSYMNRLWFVPTNSTNVVYLQTVGGISGSASVFPLGSELKKGGYIMAIGTWTVDTRQNVDEYIAFISSRGEVLVYQGTDPTTANTFALTGKYQVGAPIGRRCLLRIAGDMLIISVDGVIGMSEMLSTDRAAANRVSITSIIMNEMALAAQSYKNNFGWQIVEFAFGTLIIINVPIQENSQSMQFVMNTITGAWCRFLGLDATGAENPVYGINANCWEVDAFDNIYFGGNDGTVYQWSVGSSDNTHPITAVVKTAYNNFGNGAQLKRYPMLQPLITTTGNPIPAIGINVDFKDISILSTEEPVTTGEALWNQVYWNNFNWPGGPTTTDSWTSVQGIGHYVSIVTQLTTQSTMSNPTAYFINQLNGWNIIAEQGAFV